MSHANIVENRNTFVDKTDLPEESVIVSCEDGIVPLLSLAPRILSCEASDAEIIAVLECVDKEHSGLLNKTHAQMLAFKLNKVQVLHLCATNLSEVFSNSITSWTDLQKMKWNEKLLLSCFHKHLEQC